jgi:16S rRNA (guanine966-N2)-methyltransferase
MVRITSGIYKNKRLKVPVSARPVRERIKLAVFSILEDYGIKDKFILDLFAGSGNLGFEALSRGASSCTFIDSDYESIKSIKENATAIGLLIESEEIEEENKAINIIKAESSKFIGKDTTHYDIIFMDPPYGAPVIHILKNVHKILKPSGIVVYFYGSKQSLNINEINVNLKTTDERSYGATKVDFIVKT